jgi:uncharacterized protein YkwD
MKQKHWAAVVLAVCCASSGAVAADEAHKALPGDRFTHYTAESFRKLKTAQEKIQPDQVNRDLLDAAVFHETNRRRQQHGLPALAFDARAREAARMQSRAMAKHAFVGHDNPFDPELKTMMDRARRAGLKPRSLAENVASAFARQYEGGEKFYVRIEGGQKISSAQPGGPQIPMRSYIEFAEALVDGWMKSAGHRKNILDESATHLGCACEPSPVQATMEKFYGTQVFFTPLAR